MKRIIYISAVLLLLTTLTGCASLNGLNIIATSIEALTGAKKGNGTGICDGTCSCSLNGVCDGTGKENGTGACTGMGNGKGNCRGECEPTVKMTAKVLAVGDPFEVEVISGEYGAQGIYWIVTGNETKVTDASGSTLTLGDIKVGDEIKIIYGGQVMMSYPPQIYAREIRIL